MPITGSEVGLFDKLLEWAWAFIYLLIGLVWRKHNQDITDIKMEAKQLDARIDEVARTHVLNETYETNRKEVRDVQIKTFDRLDAITQALSRIEGKLDK
jgi:hypothetical protein